MSGAAARTGNFIDSGTKLIVNSTKKGCYKMATKAIIEMKKCTCK